MGQRGSFPLGNTYAKDGNGSGRPKGTGSIRNAEVEGRAMEKIRKWMGDAVEEEVGGWDEAFKVIARRAFVDANAKTGLVGEYRYVKLMLAYAFGQPATTVEMHHTNTVDLFKAMMEQQMAEVQAEQEVTVDGEVSQ